MKTIQITMDADLLEQVDECARSVGATRSGFARDALRTALQQYRERELEKRHRNGYRKMPSTVGEFDLPEEDQAWGDEAWSGN